MAGNSADHHAGGMDIHEQQHTFHSFLVLGKWGSLIIAVGVLFFSLLFAVQVGFMGAAVTALVVLVAGIALLREKKKPAH